MKREKGFSLWETLLVLILMLSLFAVVTPLYSRAWAYWQLQLTALGLLTGLREAQAQAMLHGDVHEVRFAWFEPRYWLYEDGRRRGEVVYPAGIFYPYGYLQLPDNHVRFYRNGHISLSGSMPLVNSYGDRVTLTLYMHTGRIAWTGGVQP